MIISINTFSKFYSLHDIQFSFSISTQPINNIIKQNFHYLISGLFERIALIGMREPRKLLHIIKMKN